MPLRDWAKSLGKRIEKSYPLTKIDADTAQVYLEEFMVMADEFGRERTEQGVHNAVRYCKFPPSIAEIRNSVPAKRVNAWQTPTAEEMAEAEAARKSPEAKQFFALLRKIKTEKRGGDWKAAAK